MRDGSRATAIPAKGGLVAADLDGKVLGQRDEYVIVDLASGWASESYPVQVARSPAALDNPAEFKTTKLLLRKISKGTYAVGSPEHEVGHRFDERLHEVVLSRDYYVSVYEITQKQWNLVMGNSPSAYRGDTLPVENVSWTLVRGGKWPGGDPAQGSFVGRLRQRTQGALFDLPTEAQWETACRAGTLTALSNNRNLRFPDRDATVDPVAWHFHNVPSGTHQEVGTREANGWGLYDMHGNVWEMCLDVYADYPVSVVTDPVGGPEPKHAQTARRVVRGGGYRNHAVSTFRSAYRTFELPGTRKGDVGFRLVLNVVNGL
jgi:formylglycine-generating enzyme required for sulfatase activity